jgi:hypothetical protein
LNTAPPPSPATAELSHAQYCAAYANGEIRVDIDTVLAYRYLSARLLLPLVMLSVLGMGVSVALALHWFPGVLLVVLGFALPRLTRMSAPSFLMSRSLADPTVYEDARRLDILRIVPVE